MEEIISSVKNELVVKTKKIRDDFDGKLFLDNPKTILEAYLSNLQIEYVLLDKSKKQEFYNTFQFLNKTKVILVSSNVISFLSETKTPQGIVAVVKIEKENSDYFGNCLVLENLQDPGNLGTIIRSARGTNFRDIVLINCVSPYNQKVVRSTMGSLFFERFHFFKSTDEFLIFAKKMNLTLLVADMGGENLFKVSKPTKKFGIVIGNEGNGVSNLMLKNCEKLVSIPMKNNLESLNAGVASAILMYYFDNI